MIEIIPAVLPKTKQDIEDLVQKFIETDVQTIQIDLVDGSFASPKTWPYNLKNQYEEYKVLEKDGFPGWQDIDIELDLMIENPLEMLEKFISWGPSRVIVHASSVNITEYISFLKEHKNIQSFVHFGIAFNVTDSIADYKDVFEYIDFVQCMGIETVGLQGQKFSDKVFTQIEQIQKLCDLPISVDGGVTSENSQVLISKGVSRLVSGSFLSKAIDVHEALQKLTGDNFEI